MGECVPTFCKRSNRAILMPPVSRPRFSSSAFKSHTRSSFSFLPVDILFSTRNKFNTLNFHENSKQFDYYRHNFSCTDQFSLQRFFINLFWLQKWCEWHTLEPLQPIRWNIFSSSIGNSFSLGCGSWQLAALVSLVFFFFSFPLSPAVEREMSKAALWVHTDYSSCYANRWRSDAQTTIDIFPIIRMRYDEQKILFALRRVKITILILHLLASWGI